MNGSLPNELEIGHLTNLTTYQAGVMQATAHRSMQKLCDEILKPYDLTKMQWLIIGTVLDAGPQGIRLTDVARKLGTTLAYLTTTVNVLQRRNILQRHPHLTDQRSKLVRLHPEFGLDCAEIEEALRKGLRRSIYSHITPLEFRMYLKVLYQLSQLR